MDEGTNNFVVNCFTDITVLIHLLLGQLTIEPNTGKQILSKHEPSLHDPWLP